MNPDMNLRNRLLIILAIELTNMLATRVTIYFLPWTSVEAELIRTTLRIVTALIYWHLMKPFILSKTPAFDNAHDTSLLAGLLLFFSIPVLVGNYALEPTAAWLFAVTSFPVAVKEEFLFRGIVQNLLERKLGAIYSIMLTSVIFTAWHIGTWDLTFWTFAQIFFASIILGLVYSRTGSILLVIAIHGFYDALFCFTPLLRPPLDNNFGFVPLLAGVIFVYFWACFGKGGFFTRSSVPHSRKAE